MSRNEWHAMGNHMTGIVLAVLLVGVVGCRQEAGSESLRDVRAADAPVIDASDLAGPEAEGRRASVSVREDTADEPYDDELEGYLCHADEDCEAKGILGAHTVEEAAWLKRHGYPTEHELAHLETLSDDELKAAAESGSLPALVVIGQRHVEQTGDVLGGLVILGAAERKGSLYAYYGLSKIYSADTDDKNMIDAGAYLRLAYMRGDYRAADQLAMDFSRWGPVDFSSMDRRAARLYENRLNSRDDMRTFPRPTAQGSVE